MTAGAPRILLAGATGLVGGLVLQALLSDAGFRGNVLAPVRRPLDAHDDRLQAPVCDFDAAATDEQLMSALGATSPPLDAYACCLGTTLRAAGSRAAFIAVDRELVLRLARVAHGLGARRAVLVSSVGASRQSGNFYLRVKGEVEDAMAAVGFTRLDIVQPGLLIGPRAQRRPAEAIAQALAPFANPLLRGRLRAYRSLSAADVAQAIASLLLDSDPAPGEGVLTYPQIRARAARYSSRGSSAGIT